MSYDLYDIAPNAAVNKNGNLFRWSENNKWYRVKKCEEFDYPELKEALERAWQKLGLYDRKFPTEKHVIKRQSLKQKLASGSHLGQKEEDRQEEKFRSEPKRRLTQPVLSVEDLDDFCDEFALKTNVKAKTKTTASTASTTRQPKKKLAQEELPEFEPSTSWLAHVSKHRHRAEAARLERELELDLEPQPSSSQTQGVKRNHSKNADDEPAYNCTCSAGCTAPRIPLALIDPTLRTKKRSKIDDVGPSPLDVDLSKKIQRALKDILRCAHWRAWLRSSKPGSRPQRFDDLTKLEAGVHDLVDEQGTIVGAVFFDSEEKISVVAEPSMAKETKSHFMAAGFKHTTVTKVKEGKPNNLQLLLKTALAGLLFPAKPRDLLQLEPVVRGVAKLAQAEPELVTAQLKYVL
jgi:hypothetical protein